MCEEMYGIQNTVCKVSPWDPVCLVCPVYQKPDVTWFIAETRIAYGDLNLGKRKGVSVNDCHETNASLGVKSCDAENESSIRCQQGLEVLAKFTLICKIDDKDINQSNPHDNHPNFTLKMYITIGVTLSLAVGCTLAISVHCSLRKRGRFTTSEGFKSSSSQTILNEQVLSGVPFEYWNAHMSVDGSNKMDCFAKKLSDKATIGDYATLKLLAESLSSFQMGEGFVKLLHISTQTIPFGFFYETMRCGTLQDHVMNHFRKKSRINKTIKRQLSYFYRPVLKELLIFAVNIAQAMHYLASQKFCHPALSLRKVLMTPQGSCKLYDIYPNNLCMERVKHLMKKVKYRFLVSPKKISKRRFLTGLCYQDRTFVQKICFELWCLAGKRTTPCDLHAVIYCKLFGVNMKSCMRNIKTVITQKYRSDSMSIVKSVNGVIYRRVLTSSFEVSNYRKIFFGKKRKEKKKHSIEIFTYWDNPIYKHDIQIRRGLYCFSNVKNSILVTVCTTIPTL
ncbi:hypothetical protein BSL78_06488 [Apostichopus japonicus]|uniref:Serine-threonine/tyrosine-protein kinase catalytic domain-containing protein n=1 Tax=Stichopus japonicus TaxID=307972 RepID=A0A2G8L8Q7_STIJA|nr:hypothetical protein BSL78_06488 [Apostichopus japonicus]